MLSEKPLLPSVPFRECPIQVSLGVLGRKWTMLILRDIGFLKVDRFNQIMRATPGLTPRILSLRLSQLEEAGFLRRVETDHSVRWALTDKGEDTLPLLLGFIEFGSKWNADEVFEDKRPRRLSELFPGLPLRKVA
jgi:DNA-binding HxlR family transcriptional regulator